MRYMPFHIGTLTDADGGVSYVGLMGDHAVTGDSEDEVREAFLGIYMAATTKAKKARLPAVTQNPPSLGPGWSFIKLSG